MNQLVPADQTSTKEIGIAIGAGGASIAPQNLGEVVRFAEVMCRADIALPKHLRGNAGACMAVALQALEWQMSPFAVASKSYAVNGTIAYEAQLIAAVVNTRSGIKGRLKYDFVGDGNEMVCRVTGVLDGEECEYESPPFGSITPKNSPLWKSDPRQQLGYFSARSWARRHCPEVILGVYDRDEASTFQGPDNAKDVTPSLQDRIAAARGSSTASEGFDRDFVTRETSTLTDEPVSATTIEDIETSGEHAPASLADEAGPDASTPGAAPTGPADLSGAEPGHAEDDAQQPSTVTSNEEVSSSATTLSDSDREFLVRVFKALRAAVGPDVDVLKRQSLMFKDEIAGMSSLVKAKATKIRTELEDCCGEKPAKGHVAVGKYLSSLIGVDERELAS